MYNRCHLQTFIFAPSSYSLLLPIVNVCQSTIWRGRVLVMVYDIRGLVSFRCVVRMSRQCNHIVGHLSWRFQRSLRREWHIRPNVTSVTPDVSDPSITDIVPTETKQGRWSAHLRSKSLQFLTIRNTRTKSEEKITVKEVVCASLRFLVHLVSEIVLETWTGPDPLDVQCALNPRDNDVAMNLVLR